MDLRLQEAWRVSWSVSRCDANVSESLSHGGRVVLCVRVQQGAARSRLSRQRQSGRRQLIPRPKIPAWSYVIVLGTPAARGGSLTSRRCSQTVAQAGGSNLVII